MLSRIGDASASPRPIHLPMNYGALSRISTKDEWLHWIMAESYHALSSLSLLRPELGDIAIRGWLARKSSTMQKNSNRILVVACIEDTSRASLLDIAALLWHQVVRKEITLSGARQSNRESWQNYRLSPTQAHQSSTLPFSLSSPLTFPPTI